MTSPTRVSPDWVAHPRRDVAAAAQLAEALSAPRAVAEVLVNRGLDSVAKARRFLDPQLSDLLDPSGMAGLPEAVARLARALERQEGIFVQGDYDVDGITSTFLLGHALEQLGARTHLKIPHRTIDGYGLSVRAVDAAARLGCTLIVTVDCGITACDAVDHARTRGLDVIITDHHEPGPRLPQAHAVLDPKRSDCAYPFKSLAGVGVALKLVQGLWRSRGVAHDDSALREVLDVVALGTIADVVPLVGENRVFARLGLERLHSSTRHGIVALKQAAGLADKRITSGHVAFMLAPRINAAGRLGNAEQGLRLLQARDAHEARDCAESLEEDNARRRSMDEAALLDASDRVERELGWPDCASIVLWSSEWHPGVLGVVAARLVERYQRPTVLIAVQDGTGRGSGRSLPGLDLKQMLDACGDLLRAWGGHTYAAGLTLDASRLPELRDRIETEARRKLKPEMMSARLEVDCTVHLRECDRALAGWLDQLAPHGLENPEPTFVAPGLLVRSASAVGGGKHLRAVVEQDGVVRDVIGFGLGASAREISQGGRWDAAFVPTLDVWQGVERIQLKVKGVRPS